jgi:hypothetical protein
MFLFTDFTKHMYQWIFIRVLWRIIEPEREDVAEAWGTLNNKEFCNLYTSPNVVRVIKSRMMR